MNSFAQALGELRHLSTLPYTGGLDTKAPFPDGEFTVVHESPLDVILFHVPVLMSPPSHPNQPVAVKMAMPLQSPSPSSDDLSDTSLVSRFFPDDEEPFVFTPTPQPTSSLPSAWTSSPARSPVVGSSSIPFPTPLVPAASVSSSQELYSSSQVNNEKYSGGDGPCELRESRRSEAEEGAESGETEEESGRRPSGTTHTNSINATFVTTATVGATTASTSRSHAGSTSNEGNPSRMYSSQLLHSPAPTPVPLTPTVGNLGTTLLSRKRHVGNDWVHIIFCEAESEPQFHPTGNGFQDDELDELDQLFEHEHPRVQSTGSGSACAQGQGLEVPSADISNAVHASVLDLKTNVSGGNIATDSLTSAVEISHESSKDNGIGRVDSALPVGSAASDGGIGRSHKVDRTQLRVDVSIGDYVACPSRVACTTSPLQSDSLEPSHTRAGAVEAAATADKVIAGAAVAETQCRLETEELLTRPAHMLNRAGTSSTVDVPGLSNVCATAGGEVTAVATAREEVFKETSSFGLVVIIVSPVRPAEVPTHSLSTRQRDSVSDDFGTTQPPLSSQLLNQLGKGYRGGDSGTSAGYGMAAGSDSESDSECDSSGYNREGVRNYRREGGALGVSSAHMGATHSRSNFFAPEESHTTSGNMRPRVGTVESLYSYDSNGNADGETMGSEDEGYDGINSIKRGKIADRNASQLLWRIDTRVRAAAPEDAKRLRGVQVS